MKACRGICHNDTFPIYRFGKLITRPRCIDNWKRCAQCEYATDDTKFKFCPCCREQFRTRSSFKTKIKKGHY